MFAQYAKDLTTLYVDTMDIYRSSKVTNDDNTEDNVISSYPYISDVACRISFKTLDVPYEVTNTGEPVTTALKLFCAPDTDIIAGDFVEAVKSGKTYKGYAGQPAQYASHKEIMLTHKGRA